ncbi:hypothetical protein HanRHA438_Chr04g0167851 [Helianthus annuus]|nr:hypothetical protein HanRHA438_Chr04g0167851 [Helianthus annuus]
MKRRLLLISLGWLFWFVVDPGLWLSGHENEGKTLDRMVSSSILNPPGFYRLCIVVPSGGCRVGFSPELVAWWARGSVRAGWAAAGYLSANGCCVWSTWRSYVGRSKKFFGIIMGVILLGIVC